MVVQTRFGPVESLTKEGRIEEPSTPSPSTSSGGKPSSTSSAFEKLAKERGVDLPAEQERAREQLEGGQRVGKRQPITRLESFSPKARAKLGLSQSKEGFTILEGTERKTVLTSTGRTVRTPRSATIDPKEVEKESVKQAKLKKQERKFVIGRIPEKGTKLKTYSQLTEDEKKIAVGFPMAERGLLERGVPVVRGKPHEYVRPIMAGGQLTKINLGDLYRGYTRSKQAIKDKLPVFPYKFVGKEIKVPSYMKKLENSLNIRHTKGKLTPSEAFIKLSKFRQGYYDVSLRTARRVYEDIRENPEIVPLAYLGGMVTGGLLTRGKYFFAKTGVSKLLGEQIGKMEPFIQKTIIKSPKVVFSGAYFGYTGYKVYKEKPSERFPKAVSSLLTEYIPFTKGMQVGIKGTEKLTSIRLKLEGKTRLPVGFEEARLKAFRKISPIAKVSGVQVINKGEGKRLEHIYPRKLITEKSFGEPRGVTIQTGTLKKLGTTYDIRLTSIGRSDYGVIRGDILDVHLKKTGRVMNLKYLTKGDVLIKEVNIPYQKESITPFKDYVKILTPTRRQVDLGIKEGESESLYRRETVISKTYRFLGRQRTFKGMRDVTRAYAGTIKSELYQKDIASPKVTTTTVLRSDMPKFIDKKIELPTIKYAIQPKYRPHKAKIEATLSENIRTHTGEPGLTQRRRLISEESFNYAETQTRSKPFKAILKGMPTLGKRGELFSKSRTVTQKPILEVPSPEIPSGKISLLNRKPLLTINQLDNILKAKSLSGAIPLTRTDTQVEKDIMIEPISRSTLISSPIVTAKADTKTETEQRLAVNIKNILATKTNTKTETKTLTKTESKTLTDLITNTKVKQIIQTNALTKTPTTIKTPAQTKIPRFPMLKVPIVPVSIVPFRFAQVQPRRKRKRGRFREDLVFIPGFTSKALGLEVKILKASFSKQLRGKTFTGFEFRKGVVIG